MKKTRTNKNQVRVTIRVEIAKMTRVKTYKRLRNGRIEKVRGYYRRH